MADLRNKYGDVVYRIEGDRIIDVYGNWLYTIVGDRINDTYGNWKYNIVGEYLFDTYGNRIGEMKNLADILPNPKASTSSGGSSGSSTPKRHFPKRDESSGCLGWFFAILVFLFLSNWGGRIGVILGIIFTVHTIATDGAADTLNAIFIGLFATFLLGGVGAIIGAIVNFIRRQVKKSQRPPAKPGA